MEASFLIKAETHFKNLTCELKLGKRQVTVDFVLWAFFCKDSNHPSIGLSVFPKKFSPWKQFVGKENNLLDLTHPKALQLRESIIFSLCSRPDTPTSPSPCLHYPKPKHPRCVTKASAVRLMFHKEIRATKNTHGIWRDSQALKEVPTTSTQQNGLL